MNRFSPPRSPVADVAAPLDATVEPDTESVLLVTYELRFADVFSFGLARQFLSPATQLLTLVVAVWVSNALDSPADFLARAASVLPWYLFFWIVQAAVLAMTMRSRANRMMLTRHVLGVGPEAVRSRTRYTDMKTWWPGVTRVVESAGFVAIYTSRSAASLVPARAFRSADERRAFVAYARDAIQGSRGR